MKKIISKLTILACGALALGACNAVQGLGQDIQSVGDCGEDVINGDDC